jgi:hypothetical protein
LAARGARATACDAGGRVHTSGTPDGMAAAMLATLTKTDGDNTTTSNGVIIFKT